MLDKIISTVLIATLVLIIRELLINVIEIGVTRALRNKGDK